MVSGLLFQVGTWRAKHPHAPRRFWMFFLVPVAVIHQGLHTERGLNGRQLVGGIRFEFASRWPSRKASRPAWHTDNVPIMSSIVIAMLRQHTLFSFMSFVRWLIRALRPRIVRIALTSTRFGHRVPSPNAGTGAGRGPRRCWLQRRAATSLDRRRSRGHHAGWRGPNAALAMGRWSDICLQSGPSPRSRHHALRPRLRGRRWFQPPPFGLRLVSV